MIRRKADEAVFIMDTKWKILADSKANYGISQADMYQMYAYQKKYQAQNVTLMYPRTEKLQTETMVYRSNDLVTVQVQFIDLFEPNTSINLLANSLSQI